MGRIPSCDKSGLKKGPWTPEEDQKLVDYIHKHGHGRWRTLPKNAGLKRCGKSCRLRWANYLRPDIKRGRFSFEEEEAIIQLHRVLGNKWSTIASRLPGRTDNEIKNHWNTHIRKRLLKMGLDPVTHAPRLDLLQLSSFLYSTFYNSSSSSSSSHTHNLNNVPNLLGIMDPELLNLLATTLLSCQGRTQFLSQQHQAENQLAGLFEINPNYQFQSQLSVQQLPNPLNASFQHQPHLTDSSSSQSSVPPITTNQLGSNYDFPKFESSIINSRTQSSDVNQYHHNFQNMGTSAFDSLLSSSRPGTTFHSSPAMTYVNSSSSSSAINEDDRDSFCTNILNMYHDGFSGTQLL